MKTGFQIAECSLSYAKVVQASAMKTGFQIAECSLSYAKVVQANVKSSSLLECFTECSLSYAKIVHFSDLAKRKQYYFHFLHDVLE